jgi:5-methyltetrahydrofolate--homocysteine methyltransferase
MSEFHKNEPGQRRLPALDLKRIRGGAPFVMIGERLNVNGSARFARLVREGKDGEILKVARDQLGAGAGMLDVNVDDPALDSKAEMARIVDLLASDEEISKAPVMLDSAHWEVLESGLESLDGAGAANSLNLKGGEDEFRSRASLVRERGAALVFMAFDENGLAGTRERKVDVCTRAFRVLTEDLGFRPQDVILDPALLAVGTGIPGDEDHAVSFIESCRTLKAELPGCLVSAGISNVSFAYRGNNFIRKAMHTVFLHHAIEAGMDMAIVNVEQLGIYEDIPEEIRGPVEDLVLNRSPKALAQVMELAVRTRGRQ